MKEILRKLCSPVLSLFESSEGEGEYEYKPSHRTILIVLGLLCLVIASVSLMVTIMTGEAAGIIPIMMFLFTGLVCEIVGWLGSDRAVARIWKRR
ncbi:hypothetical protein [Marinomonas sp. IMCC 4694]|uniref:hypothetical protein n=1 Tax=Marinomonas sp. IMCC 4694 TaxID=2605432 RepID=UPI0011E82926|nr:hypothetical protein [Marinomonas sp. IMCC 4694]TYL48360.1 hypothetical protein FXV75_10640 [Marinomonas sp. IMCC 4694]